MNDNLTEFEYNLIIVDADKSKDSLVYLKKFIDIESITYRKLISLISCQFNIKVNSKIRAFNFNGIEILDDSDLYIFSIKESNNNIIYFSTCNKTSNRILLNCFDIKNKLGEGGFGKVYLVKQIFTDKTFAIKFIKLKKNTNSKYLIKEIETLSKLDHPKIIKLIAYFYLEDEDIALLLEYVSGGSLKNYLKNCNNLEENKARDIVSQILQALSYCHAKDIVHRDLKLENIMFNSEDKDEIKLIDFGISGVHHEKIDAGSFRYLPPEVINGTNTESKPSVDMWSIGCITFELIVGKKLFERKSFNDLKDQVNNTLEVEKYNISKEASNFINSLTIYNHEERLNLTNAINHPWIKNISIIESDNSLPTKEVCGSTSSNNIKKQKHIKNIFNSLSKSSELDKLMYGNSAYILRNYNKSVDPIIGNKTSLNSVRNEINKLSSKINSETNSAYIYELNYKLLKEHGKIPNYLQPIGYSKEQKIKVNKIKKSIYVNTNENFFKDNNNSVKNLSSYKPVSKSNNILDNNKILDLNKNLIIDQVNLKNLSNIDNINTDNIVKENHVIKIKTAKFKLKNKKFDKSNIKSTSKQEDRIYDKLPRINNNILDNSTSSNVVDKSKNFSKFITSAAANNTNYAITNSNNSLISNISLKTKHYKAKSVGDSVFNAI